MTEREFNYFIGLFQTDGTLYETTRNRGKITIELSKKDEDILRELNEKLPVKSSLLYRTRNTNFKDDYSSAKLVIYDLEYRNKIKEFCSIKAGKKDDSIGMPVGINHPFDYFRGVIDGDGSIGFKENGVPFLSLVTNSEQLYKDFTNFVFIVTGQRKMVKRNERDGIYNIFITAEHAVHLIEELYRGEPSLFLLRKHNVAMEVLSWKRTSGKRRSANVQKWTSYEDEYILTNSLEDSVRFLYRSEKSIKTRLWRLSKQKTKE